MIALLLSIAGCSAEDFEDTYYPGGEVSSPDGGLIATFYGLGGGGAAGWLFEFVTVRSADTPFDRSQPVALSMGYGYEVCLHWESDNHLVISRPSGAIIHEQESSLEVGRSIVITVAEVPERGGEMIDGCLGAKLRLQPPSADDVQK